MSLESFPNPNQNEHPPEIEGQEILLQSRWSKLMKNPDVHKGAIALLRTLINTGISIADVIPVVGDIASWGADALKSHTVKKIFSKLGLPDFDLTPSVSRTVAWGSEAFEVATLGVLPSHIIESAMQFKNEDLGLLKKAFTSAREILKSEKATSVNTEAIDTFINDEGKK